MSVTYSGASRTLVWMFRSYLEMPVVYLELSKGSRTSLWSVLGRKSLDSCGRICFRLVVVAVAFLCPRARLLLLEPLEAFFRLLDLVILWLFSESVLSPWMFPVSPVARLRVVCRRVDCRTVRLDVLVVALDVAVFLLEVRFCRTLARLPCEIQERECVSVGSR